MPFDRRRLLQLGAASTLGVGLGPLAACSRPGGGSAQNPAPGKADYVIHIAETKVELAPGVEVTTTAYNGQVPGPLIRLTEGRPVAIDITNDTARHEQVHWHGQRLPVDVDGSA